MVLWTSRRIRSFSHSIFAMTLFQKQKLLHSNKKFESQCLKVTEKVAFNMASEVFIFYIHKSWLKMQKNGPFWVTFKHLSDENHILVLSARKFKESWCIEFEKQHLFSTHIFDKEFWGRGGKQSYYLKKRKTIIISLIWQFYFLTTFFFFRYVERGGERSNHSKNRKDFFFMSSASR